MPAATYTANLRAAFVGLRFLPDIIAIGHNSLNPKLILRQEDLAYRGSFFTTTLAYAEVERVAVTFMGSGTNNLTITPKTGLTNFTGNFESRAQLYQFLEVLSARGCPLTPPARQLLEQYQQQGGN